jgi:hypothetical protein
MDDEQMCKHCRDVGVGVGVLFPILVNGHALLSYSEFHLFLQTSAVARSDIAKGANDIPGAQTAILLFKYASQ